MTYNWIPVTDNRKPEDGQEVLVTTKNKTGIYLHLATYSRNLYKVDKIAFGNKRNIAGFYDETYGKKEIHGVTAWCPAPRVYTASDKD